MITNTAFQVFSLFIGFLDVQQTLKLIERMKVHRGSDKTQAHFLSTIVRLTPKIWPIDGENNVQADKRSHPHLLLLLVLYGASPTR
jgi:hypothetical protein